MQSEFISEMGAQFYESVTQKADILRATGGAACVARCGGRSPRRPPRRNMGSNYSARRLAPPVAARRPRGESAKERGIWPRMQRMLRVARGAAPDIPGDARPAATRTRAEGSSARNSRLLERGQDYEGRRGIMAGKRGLCDGRLRRRCARDSDSLRMLGI